MSTQLATLRDRFTNAEPLDAFIGRATHHANLWRDMRAHARVSDDLVRRARRIAAPRRLLVLLEDWCGDAINTIPAVAALADAVPDIELRVLERDANADLMDARLTSGTRSIPVVIVLDERFRALGWWGPRPAELQRWATSADARAMSPGDRYRVLRSWYARDRGRTTLGELLDVMERSAATAADGAAHAA